MVKMCISTNIIKFSEGTMARNSKKSKASTIILWLLVVILAAACVYVVYSYSVSKSSFISDRNFAGGLSEVLGKPAGKITEEELAQYESINVTSNAYMASIYAMYGLDTSSLNTKGVSVTLTLPGYDSSITATDDSTDEEKKAYEENQKLVKTFDAASIDYADMALFTGLKRINIYQDEKFNDLSVFSASAANVENLLVYGGTLGDISAVADFANLKELTFASCGVSDIAPLAGLTELTSLTLDDNAITDISALSGLVKLETLSLDNNTIADITPIKNLTALKTLYLGGTGTKDLETVVALPELETVSLSNNEITDISALSALNAEKILSVDLSGNDGIEDWTAVEAFKDKVSGMPEENTDDNADTSADGDADANADDNADDNTDANADESTDANTDDNADDNTDAPVDNDEVPADTNADAE